LSVRAHPSEAYLISDVAKYRCLSSVAEWGDSLGAGCALQKRPDSRIVNHSGWVQPVTMRPDCPICWHLVDQRLIEALSMHDEFVETCHIHNRALDGEGEVPHFGGLFGTGVEYGQAFRERFRYSRSFSAGEYRSSGWRPGFSSVEYCTACRAAEREWIKQFIADNPDPSTFAWTMAKFFRLTPDSQASRRDTPSAWTEMALPTVSCPDPHMSNVDPAILRIAEKLDRLRRLGSVLDVLDISEPSYTLGPTRTDAELSALEQSCGVRLPDDYRAFLIHVGDGINGDAECGGAGPGYGLYSVETLSELADRVCQPFPLEHSILQVTELEQSDDYWPTWKDASDRTRHGSLPLAHYGCGIFARLVLTGDGHGTVWIVDGAVGDIAHFADYCRYHTSGGGKTIHGGATVVDGPHSFTMWYEDWLDANLTPAAKSEPRDPVYLPNAYLVPVRPWEPLPTTPCPECGKPLRTAAAKQCFECGADWHHS